MATIGSVSIAITPDFRRFHQKVKNYMRTLDDLTINVDANLSKFREKVAAATRDTDAQVDVDADTAAARAKIAALARDQRVTITVDVDKSQLGQVSRMISGMFDGNSGGLGGNSGGLGILNAGSLMSLARPAGVLTAVMLGLGPAVALASGALAAMPAVIAGVAAPLGALAFLGADLQKAFEDTENWLVKPFLSLKEPLTALQTVMRESFLTGFDATADGVKYLEEVIHRLVGPLSNLTEGIGNAMVGFLSGFVGGTGLEKLEELLYNIGDTIYEMGPGLAAFSAGFLNLANSVTGRGLSEAFNSIADSFERWTQNPANLDKIRDAISGTWEVVKKLGAELLKLVDQGLEQMKNPDFINNMKGLAEGLGTALQAIAGFGNAFASWGPVFTVLGVLIAAIGTGISSLQHPIKFIINIIKYFAESVMFAFNEIKRVVLGVWNWLTGIFNQPINSDGLVMSIGSVSGGLSNLAEGAKRAWAAITGGIGAVIGALSNLAGIVTGAIGAAFNGLAGIVSGAWNAMVGAIQAGVGTVTGIVSALPGQIVAALGDLGSLLFNSGVALIDGFARGIISAGARAVQAAADVLAKVRAFFPFSPAERGPFSGTGYTTYSGQALIDGLAEGITAGKSGAVASMTNVMTELGNVIDDSIKERQQKMQEATQSLGQSMLNAPVELMRGISDVAMQDIGISGSGLMGAGLDYATDLGMGLANQFVFNVNNMDDAIQGQQAQQRKQTAGIAGR